jgi:myo-inositol-1(or 4)-monophosphatase
MKEHLKMVLRMAGAELMRQFGRNTGFRVKESQSSIVTKADLKSDALISGLIRENYPDHNIISEESGFSNRNSRYTWIIDPLDGTSNFAASIPWFGILIALFDGQVPIMGGAYLPSADRLYFAEKGHGAMINGRKFSMLKNKGLKNSLISFNVDFTDNEKILDESISIYRNLVKSARNIRCTNSLVDFLYVAEGKFGGVINLFTRIWDISALILIIEEAGGSMLDVSGDEIEYRLDESSPSRNFPVMAGSPEILDELRRKVLKSR